MNPSSRIAAGAQPPPRSGPAAVRTAPPGGRPGTRKAFTLVEMLVVIGIISILASIAIAAVTNASRDSSLRVAQQQQAVLQTALTAWLSAQPSVAAAKAAYNPATAYDSVKEYLDPQSRDNIFTNNGGTITSEALDRAGRTLSFTAWGTDPPYVQMNSE